jgi:hypothetical protein
MRLRIGGAEAEPCPPDSIPETGVRNGDMTMMKMMAMMKLGQGVVEKKKRKKRCSVTLGHENVNLPDLHGNERVVDGIDLNEDEGLRRFARFLIVVSNELDPATQVLPKGEPDRPDAILECQFEKGNLLRSCFVELPPEKTGADGERARRYIEHRPCDGQLVPEFLDPCEDLKWWCHTITSSFN